MSSYLNIYLLPKEQEKKLLLTNISRNSGVYQAFNEYGVAYAGNEEKYTRVTPEMMMSIKRDVKEDIDRVNKRLTEFEKHAAGNIDIINDILSEKEYLEELQDTYSELCWISDIVHDLENFDWLEFEGMYVNID